AIVAMYFFLRRFGTTVLVAVAIPISIVATFVLIYFLRQAGVIDLTLNVVSLAGLMLALGMLVDNSIVVIESIFRHRNELGKDSRSAALSGASEVAMPILASTATTLCVFLPVIFLGGGGFFRIYLEDIGTMICIVMVASLVVALTVVPLVAVPFLKRQEARPSRWIEAPTRAYGRVLRFTLRHRFLFVLAIVAMLAWVVSLFSTIERSFSSRSLERQVVIKVDTPRQYSPEQTAALYQEVYEILDARRDELDIADIAYSYDRDTGRSRGSWRRNRQLDVYLEDEDDGNLSTVEARERIRALLPTKAGVELRIMMSRGHSGSGGIELELSGDDPAVLELIARRVTAALAAIPSIRDVDSSLESGDQEIWVRVQPERLQQAGLSSNAVAFTVSNALSGRAVSRFQTGDREVDMVVRYREQDRRTLDHLKQVPVFAAGVALPLEALADFELVAGPRSIERENHLAKVSVSANTTDPRASFAAMRAVSELMDRMPLPPGYEWSYGRWTRRMQQDQRGALFALLFALPLVYMLMAALFESFTQPLTIMFSIPFALLGVGVVMKLANQPWETMTMIGLLVLLGVVVNNAIVLIDHVNRLRRQGLPRDEAIVLGGQHRLRPILITAVTTIVGLVPMIAPFLWPEVFGAVEGRAASWAPIGLVIIGGLTTSTFLTLMIIPTIYSLIDDLTRFAHRVAKEVIS
ncbi:MAG: efflux RND transporter permease subunit, partial [Thermoanaerobaculia bacterium]